MKAYNNWIVGYYAYWFSALICFKIYFNFLFLLRYEMSFFGSNLKIERIKNQKNSWVLKIVTVAAKCDFKQYVNTMDL